MRKEAIYRITRKNSNTNLNHKLPQLIKTKFLYAISLKHQQTGGENKAKCKLDYLLIHYQFLQTQSMRIVWQTVRRITYEILGVKRLPETGTKN